MNRAISSLTHSMIDAERRHRVSVNAAAARLADRARQHVLNNDQERLEGAVEILKMLADARIESEIREWNLLYTLDQ